MVQILHLPLCGVGTSTGDVLLRDLAKQLSLQVQNKAARLGGWRQNLGRIPWKTTPLQSTSRHQGRRPWRVHDLRQPYQVSKLSSFCHDLKLPERRYLRCHEGDQIWKKFMVPHEKVSLPTGSKGTVN